MNEREALKLALEALDCIYSPLHVREIEKVGNAMKVIKEALTQPEQKPVAFRNKQTGEFCTGGFLRGQLGQWTPLYEEHTIPLYITPPQRKPLTDEQLIAAYESEQQGRYGDHIRSLRAIEAAHGIKGE